MIEEKISKADAIRSLNPSLNVWGYVDNPTVEGGTAPTDAEIDAEVIRLQAVQDTQAYARNRKAEYPETGVQFNKIYDDGLTKWKSEMVDPVKTKWPKDNSGPVE